MQLPFEGVPVGGNQCCLVSGDRLETGCKTTDDWERLQEWSTTIWCRLRSLMTASTETHSRVVGVLVLHCRDPLPLAPSPSYTPYGMKVAVTCPRDSFRVCRLLFGI